MALEDFNLFLPRVGAVIQEALAGHCKILFIS